MNATAWLVLGVIGLIFAWAGAVVLLEMFSSWAIQREVERTAADTFAADFIVENADVAGPDAEVDALLALAQIEEQIELALAPLREGSA